MKSKKLLGILMSATLTLGLVAPAVNVQASQSKNYSNGSYYGAYHGAQADEERIIEMLKKQGKITENTSQEEIQRILQEFLGEEDPASYLKPTKEEIEITESMNEKAEAYEIEQDENLSTRKSKDVPEYVQPEGEWTDKKVTVKPLVVLMDFPDYRYDSITKDETNFYFNDYSKDHFQRILFNEGTYKGPVQEDGSTENFVTMKQWYKEQSGGSFVVDGGVAGWYTAKEKAAYYGGQVGKTKDINARALVKEAFDNVAADPNVNLADYDLNNDGRIDQFIVVHAGVGQEAGGGNLGTDAIWSHKWSVGNTPYTVKDKDEKEFSIYTYNMDPQDGAPGVFCHEFGHALGLPDEYDTQYTGTGEPVGYWSIMASGSWTGIVPGAEPSGFSPWCKQFLEANYGGNWLTGTTLDANTITEEGYDALIDQASTKGTNNDVVRINLPQKQTVVTKPISGELAYFSGSGNGLNNSMTKTFDLTGKTSSELTFQTWYEIEEGWDFASIQVKEEGSDTWEAIPGNITTTEHDPDADVIVANGITGHSEGWKEAKFDLSDYAGKKIDVMFKYETDGAAMEAGFYVDDIKVVANGTEIFADDAEGTTEFDLNGFTKNDGILRSNHYYLVEWRNQQGTDSGLARLRGGAMSYDPGLLIWYVDEMYNDNWTGIHPGEGFVGAVDADQIPVMWLDPKITKYSPASGGYQMHDAAFSLRRNKSMSIALASGLTTLDNNTFMHPIYDDSRDYSNPGTPHTGRNIPNYGLKIYVTGESKDRSVGKIHITRTTK